MALSPFAKALLLAPLFLGVPARAEGLPTLAQVRALYQGSEARLLDRDGRLLQEMRVSWRGRVLEWVKLTEVSPALKEAVLAVEDRRFLEHGGVDLRALMGAAWQNLSRGNLRGASTLTMQTVSLLDLEGATQRGRRNFGGKLRQARLAWALERAWTKDEILEAYLNLASFRGEYRGVATAARALFGKDPHGLDLKEGYLLATLLREPAMSAESAGRRLCRYVAERPGLGDCKSLEDLAARTLGQPPPPLTRAALAPHLARRLLSATRSELRSTLMLSVQSAALAAIRDQLQNLKSQNARDAAVLVADNQSGEVLAYVGGSGDLSTSPDVDMIQSRRQAGSTLKPFLYALAFQKGYLQPDSWLLDEPFEVGGSRGSYEPDNYDHQFHGPVTAKVALASSLNIPAVRLVSAVGVAPFQALLERLGFRALEDADHYGPSLALGTADVTLFDLVQSYMALANGGEWKALRFEAGETAPPGRRLLSRSAADEVTAILSDRGFRAITFGWDSLLATPYPAAVKTGTSKDMRDNWCVGFTRDYTVGVWVGNGGGEPMWAVSGIAGAAPIWRALMDRLESGKKAKALPLLRAEAQPVFERRGFGKILYPVPGALLAVDPDIPEGRQRVLLETQGEGTLSLDGRALPGPVWNPVRGKHRLSFRGNSGALLDEVSFEVR